MTTLAEWTRAQLGFDATAQAPSTAAWLALPQQPLLQVTAGEVFRDDPGTLHGLREKLAWYPRDVWLWAMASQWHLIANAEPRVGRTIEAGDARGAALIAARIVRLVMELSFLQERRYRPYDKWFGTAFARLDAAPTLGPQLDAVLAAPHDEARIEALHLALLFAAERHNGLDLTPPVSPVVDRFEVGINEAVRPYRVLNAGKFVDACKGAIADEALRDLVPVGTFDQLTHGDDALVNFTDWPRRLEDVYRQLLEARRG